MSALIKEYVKNHGKKKTITLKLSLVEAFYFDENANAYMLNHIYKAFFGSKIKKPFNAILHDKEEKEYINIGLFNASSKQVSYLVDILNEMKISLKKLSKKYMILTFPHSLNDYDTRKLYDLEYKEVKADWGIPL